VLEEDPDDFTFDHDAGQATCPAGITCPVRPPGTVTFGAPCGPSADGQDRPGRRSSPTAEHRDINITLGPKGTFPSCSHWADAVTALNASELPCSGSEEQMFRLTASLTDGIPVNLRRALPSIDQRNISLVIKAVPRTSGH
jgi:hypothetical protein